MDLAPIEFWGMHPRQFFLWLYAKNRPYLKTLSIDNSRKNEIMEFAYGDDWKNKNK